MSCANFFRLSIFARNTTSLNPAKHRILGHNPLLMRVSVIVKNLLFFF